MESRNTGREIAVFVLMMVAGGVVCAVLVAGGHWFSVAIFTAVFACVTASTSMTAGGVNGPNPNWKHYLLPPWWWD